jgi:hypothetical protein
VLYVIAMPSLPDDPDRYTARPLGAGDWFVPIRHVLRGAVITGVLLFGAVAGLGYALSPPPTSAVAQPIWPQIQEQATAPSRSQHVDEANGYWQPEDGYDWVTAERHDLRVEWRPGLRSRHPHVVASDEEGKWEAEASYTWVDPDRPKDYRVRPVSVR